MCYVHAIAECVFAVCVVCCVCCVMYTMYLLCMCYLCAFVSVVWGLYALCVYFLYVLCDMLCKCVTVCVCCVVYVYATYVLCACLYTLCMYSVWMSVCVHVMLECNPEVIEVLIFPHRNHASLWDSFNEKDIPEIRKIHRTHVMQICVCMPHCL